MNRHELWRRVLSVVSVVSVFTSTVPHASATGRHTPPPPVPVLAARQGSTTLPTPDPVPLLPATSGPLLPGLAFDIGISPAVSVGATVPFTLTLANRATNPGEDVVVTLPLPDGATAQPSAATNAAGDGWTWHVGHVAGQSETVLTGALTLSRMPQGAALLLTPQATATGLDAPVTRDGGALVAQPLDTSASASFTPGMPSQLRNASGKVQVKFSAKGYGRGLTLRYTAAAAARAARALAPTAPAQVDDRKGFGTFHLDATDAQGKDIHQFAAPVTLGLQYTPEQLRVLGIAEQNLTLYWYNPTAKSWEAVPTTVNSATHTASATVDHFSAFNLSDGSSPSAAFIPSLKNFQVSQFTGAASYSYPIDVPAGAGGLKPSISLSYSSAASDGSGGARPLWQAGPVGKGWTFDAGGFVARNKSSGSSDGQWDNFTFSFGGKSYTLVRGSAPLDGNWNNRAATNWTWAATDESFARFQKASTGDSWVAWTADGTRYEFAVPLLWGEDNSGTKTYETYKWLLSKVVDVHGNIIAYDYSVDSIVNSQTIHPTYYLRSILWGYDGATPGTGTARYRAWFVTGPRSDGATVVDTDWEYSPNRVSGKSGTPHEAYRVNAIQVQSFLPGASGYTTIQQYNLQYAATANSLTTDVSNGQRVLTLLGIQRVSPTSGALPATTFTYGMSQGNALEPTPGWNRLLTVDNGQGGKLTFAYAHVWGSAGMTDYAKYYGNYYRLISVKQEDTSGKDYSRATLTTYEYGTPALNDEAHSAAVVYAHYPPSGNGDSRAYLASPEKSEFRGHSWVTWRTYDGATTSGALLTTESSGFYQGGGGTEGATCTVEMSGSVVNTGGACYTAMVNAEAFKGRAFRHEIRNNNTVLRRDTHTFTRVELPFFGSDAATASNSNNYRRAGLSRAFIYESQTVEEQVEGTSTPLSKTTKYTYDTNTGNLLSKTTLGTLGTVVRKEEHWYASHVDAQTYILNREWQSAVRDDQNRLLSLTATFYDGASGAGTVPGAGDVTRVSVYRDVPLQSDLTNVTQHGQDTTYTYDVYGNKQTETTYNGLSTRLYNGSVVSYSAPGAGATSYTTTTAYDTVVHAYPVTVTNAKGHVERATYDYGLGTLTSVTDANGNTTTAGYDGFGRMTSLVKPGDTAASPTLRAYYYDTKKPFQYLIASKASGDVTGDVQYETSLFYDGLGNQVQTKKESVGGAVQNIVTDTRYDALGRVVAQSQARAVNQDWSVFNEYLAPGSTLYRATTTTYDALGRPLVITAPDGSKSEHHYGISGVLAYDDVIDANRHRTQQLTDVLGRLQRVGELTGNCATGYWASYACGGSFTTEWASAATTTYTYDPLDRLTGTLDAQGNTSSIRYDSQGHKVGQTDPDMGTWTYTYDGRGNLLTQKDAKNQTTTFTYDELSRQVMATYADGTYAQYAYDYTGQQTAGYNYGIGHRTSMATYNASGVAQTFQRWEYDNRGREIFSGHNTSLTGAHHILTTYDDAGRVKTLQYQPTDEVVTYTYDAASRPYSLCTSLSTTCYITAANYDALGHTTKLTYGNGTYQTYAYTDPLARQDNINIFSAQGENLFARSFRYDAVGNIAGIDTWEGGAPGATRQNQNYSYDERDRLTHAWTTGDTTGSYDQYYGYDLIGNLTEKGGVSQRYGSTWQGTGTGPHQMYANNLGGVWQAYGYDANGNLASSYKGTSTDGTGKRYTWDTLNRLTKVESSVNTAGTTAYTTQENYVYDADGNRTARVANGQTTVYFQGMWEDTIGVNARKLYSFGGQAIAQRDGSTGKLTYLHNDYLGSVSVTTNEQGLKASKQEFDPWGNVRAGDVPETTLDYTGQRRDSTGLLYYNARYYDPVSGRFISADTVVPGNASGGMDGVALKPLTVSFAEPGFLSKLNQENQLAPWFQLSDAEQIDAPWGPANPQSLNRYSYVNNNPVLNIDPTGHSDKNGMGGTGGNGASPAYAIPHPAGGSSAGVGTALVKAAVATTVLLAAAGGGAYIGKSLAESQANQKDDQGLDDNETSEEDTSTERDRALQTGGNTVTKGTADALNNAHDLNLRPREWGRALENLKRDLGLGNNHHGKIMESGDYVDGTGEVLGNLLDYLP